MTEETRWGEPWADDDDPADAGPGAIFDEFEPCLPGGQFDAAGGSNVAPRADGIDDDDVRTLLFTALNPGETVSVTALMDGRVFRIDLAPQVTEMTEAQLAREITAVATLARMQAQAGQYVVIGELMRPLGYDEVSTRSFLEHELHLPSPESVYAAQAGLFGDYYDNDHDRSTD